MSRSSRAAGPQKRNPISSELIVAAAKAVRQHAGLMLDAMVQDYERATGPWHAEWIALPESFVLTAGVLHQAKLMLGGLVVDEERMRKNLGMTSGLIVAEAVMMGLAPHLGRNEAHAVVYAACRLVERDGGRLADVLAGMPEVSSRLNREALERLTDPANYLGMAPQMVDRVVGDRK
jgi:3-carboxy-cis,cis-muconate cycloisomerase